jgi:HSP20 family protein
MEDDTMRLTTYSPLDVHIDKFLNDALRVAGDGPRTWTPACNTFEDEQGFWVHAALPGIDRKNIEIVVEDGVLILKGERKEETSDETRTYFAREIGWGAFSRSFRLPTNVDTTKVEATYKDGILSIALPKREESKPRRITIETK